MFKQLESVIYFVPDIDAAARWYADLLGTAVEHENPQFAFVRGPGLVLGFHPADAKCPGGIGGTTAYWEVADKWPTWTQRWPRCWPAARGCTAALASATSARGWPCSPTPLAARWG